MRIKLQATKLYVCTFVLCLAGGALWAQTSGQGRIAGQVMDSTNAAIPAVTVTLKNDKTGEVRTATADQSGHYFVNNLAPSTYSVSSQAEGLGPAHLSVTVSAGQERLLNITLQPATVSQSVNVEAGELSQIDTSSARVGANVNEREVGTLPLNGRQLSQLYLMAPGAVTAGGGSYDNIRFSGRANQENAIRVDGVDFSSVVDASPGNLNGETSTGFRLQTSLENVQEFRVDSSNYPAEYGTGTGGQITVVTKSGGNSLHGGIFEYVRNDVFDARNFFDKGDVAPLRVNQFGASAGGPIIKNRFFIFGSYEGLRQVGYQNLIEAVPSASARTRAVASVAPLMQLYPQGTPTSNPDLDLAQGVFRAPLNENSGSVRLDYRLSDKISASLRYLRDQGELQSPLNVTGNYSRVTALAHNIAMSVSQVLSPTMINETRFGYNGPKTRINGVQPAVPGLNTDLSAISIDFTGSATIAGIGGQGVSGGAARIGGLVRSNSSQNGRAQPYTNYSLTFADTLSLVRGDHQIKVGMEIRPIRIYTDRLGGTTYTYSNVAALLANTPTSVQVLGDVSAPSPLHNGASGNRFLKQDYYIGFAQDEWKLRPNLTVNYGLRYEFYSPLHEDRNLYTYFDMNSGTLDLGSGRDWYHSSKYNFGPRLGISWAPTRFNNKTVLRIGAGYYYGPGQTEDQLQTIDSDRVTVTRTSGVAFPVDSQAIINTFDLNNLSGFQPRVYMPGYQLPEKVLSYTASVQQQLPGEALLTVAYVGSQGRNLFLRSWTNWLTGVNMNPNTGAGIPILGPYGSQFSQMDVKGSGGTDHYDSLQTTVNRRFQHGLTAGGQWTWGHSLGNTGGSNEAQTTQNPADYGQDRGNNAVDVRHSMNFNVLYELPVGHGRTYGHGMSRLADALIGGWEVGSVLNYRTGLPIDLTMARNDIAYQVDATGQFVTAPIVQNGAVLTTPVVNNPYGGAFRSNRRPSVVAGVSPFLSGSSDKRYFLNPAAFSVPAPGQFGNLGRWALHGPSLSQLDLTLHKRFAVTEQKNFEFRAEIYNILNHTNFANPGSRLNDALGTGANQLQPGQAYSGTAAGPAFGTYTSTVTKDVGLGTSRQMQLSLRFNF